MEAYGQQGGRRFPDPLTRPTISAVTPAVATNPAAWDRVDADAMAAFDRRYGPVALGPVVFIIPAYNEAATIAEVLHSVPSSVCGDPVSTLVVVDGGTADVVESTVAAATAQRALACATPLNRGQGAALHLGYRVAVAHGARWIVTIDADLQWDPAEADRLVQPLLDGDADLVLGSRRLGRDEEVDSVRNTGVRVFSVLVSALTRTRITDSSSGFRAMTAVVASTVELTEPQYQATELLIGALGKGFRVIERPVSHHVRPVGGTKKGSNLAYGYHYARVIVRTWLRER